MKRDDEKKIIILPWTSHKILQIKEFLYDLEKDKNFFLKKISKSVLVDIDKVCIAQHLTEIALF